MAKIKHPYSKNIIEGERLTVGAILEEGDVYASYGGKWLSCPGYATGRRLPPSQSGVIWVRPKTQPATAAQVS